MKIDYTNLLNQSHLQIIKEILCQIKDGQGAHLNEIYLTFHTSAVKMSNALRKIYPEIMSILICGNWTDMTINHITDPKVSHSFSMSTVSNSTFSITMHFPTGLETLEIPFNSITQYIDKSNAFALKFTPSEKSISTTTSNTTMDKAGDKNNILQIDFKNPKT